MTEAKPERRVLVSNRRARHDYFVEDTFEAGLALVGTEVKSVRDGKASLQDAWVDLRPEGAVLVGAHIAEFSHASQVFNHQPRRERRLLLHRRELDRLADKVHQKGFTLIPLEIHTAGRWLKVVVGLCKGKRAWDKRDDIRERDERRDREREAKER
jgi:SsrA-binding protein